MAKRKIFAELMEGVAAMQAKREGKIILRNGVATQQIKRVLHK
jgi:hypothetical protein